MTCQIANNIIQKLNPDMTEHIFRFIGGEEVMRTTDIANILSYLGWADIMRARVSRKWRDAAKMTIVAPPSDFASDFVVDSVRSYNAMSVMSTALPNMQQISISNLGHEDIYSNGEDPDEVLAGRTANLPVHDINIISSLRQLRNMHMCNAVLNGRFPALFNFPLLQKLSIQYCNYLKFDLALLEGLPSLKELDCNGNSHLTGNIGSLRALKDSLEIIIIRCRNISGDLMDLSDFPHLEELDLRCTNVSGDIRDIVIGRNDFPALESLALPRTVHGGIYYVLHSIKEVPSLMHTIHLLLQRTPTLFEKDRLSKAFGWSLSKQSPDWYARDDGNGSTPPPFRLQFVQAGTRLGWSWCTFYGDHLCEINWLDPVPDRDSSDYAAYMEDLRRIERRIAFYRGYHQQPPTEQQYRAAVPSFLDGIEQRD
eukprot:CAMPEP_0201715500 /NCGR_PEP_ID=MMETSP0593-20130828/1674_1 /ASSEMBLY_ACC=CAM_ASM_000672 /TAXON_ID=267983 /ORGANISM="Skeletonema japonicum, Strain CCMP2506" /LENGTH=424 /DNA_ID=CAMNT_0048205017 /DNA_START=85 /DNA_END=1359 /DNA_ORIENTATION=+